MSGYDDIIGLPHHVSEKHPHMPVSDRAAQFSPFQTLKGFDDSIDETARYTESKAELDEDEKVSIGKTLGYLTENTRERPLVRAEYFVPDERKTGGRYETRSGRVKKVDTYAGVLVFEDGKSISFGDIYAIEALKEEKSEG